MLWHLRIDPSPGLRNTEALRVQAEASELGLEDLEAVAASRGFLIEGDLERDQLRDAAARALIDPIAERFDLLACPEPASHGAEQTVHILLKPGVTDPVAQSALNVLQAQRLDVRDVRSIRSYRLQASPASRSTLLRRVLSNEAVEQAVIGPLPFDQLERGTPYTFRKIEVPLLEMSDADLERASREGGLALSLEEMRTIQAHFRGLGRDPTDCELETIAQTWSEHCSHKTLKGRIEFEGEVIDSLLKQTIFKATQDLKLDWLVSVFEDNAGVVRFDEEIDVCFKVETHNHPSAIDPYGGANTGIGGVIRDPLGTGLGAKPIANTDVFCVAPPDTPFECLPVGTLHPKRVLKGVVAGVRDYGNRMGIPTINGAVCADERYLSNPLVFCGTVGTLPRGSAAKRVEPGDRIIAVGGRTGRDGIHGATFSSAELTGSSEELSGGAVQIGDPITEKKLLDALMIARERRLYRSITDCGAGGFSSAIGEMGAEHGAEVELARAPLKYEGLSYTEIWISEAQERMVLAVPPEHRDALIDVFRGEDVEATDLGRFTDTGRLELRYEGQPVADLSMRFLHEGRPQVARPARYKPAPQEPADVSGLEDANAVLLELLADWDIASKEWIIRQYDHEVQGRTLLKPLVGPSEDGPGDAALILPRWGSERALAVGCGINPRYGDLDAGAMAACVIDEAVRNVVAVGADPDRIALLDNFCWGSPEHPETLGALVAAARACHDTALALGTPFISGKDSLYNEYTHEGQRRSIPPTLLISAIGQVPEARRGVTMDLKEPGNTLLIVGETRAELGGSVLMKALGRSEGFVPRVDPTTARATFQAVFRAIQAGLVRSCHDLSEGGLAVAAAEMAIAGRLGLSLSLRDVPCAAEAAEDATLLFSESPSRFLVEARPDAVPELLDLLGALPVGRLGEVTGPAHDDAPRLTVRGLDGRVRIDAPVAQLRECWQRSIDTARPHLP